MPRTEHPDSEAWAERQSADFMARLAKAMKSTDSQSSISWGDADPSLLTAAIVSATEGGASLLFGKTSDGGALTLIVYGGKKPVKYYPVTPAGANELLDAIGSTGITTQAGKRT